MRNNVQYVKETNNCKMEPYCNSVAMMVILVKSGKRSNSFNFITTNALLTQPINLNDDRKSLNPCAFFCTLHCKFASLATVINIVWNNDIGPFVNDRNEQQSRTEHRY